MSTSRLFPGFGQLYSLSESGADQSFRVDVDLHGADAVAVTRGDVVASGATARWAMGSSKPSDVIWTTSVALLLMSGRLTSAMRASKLTGWADFPVELVGATGQRLEAYSGLVVHGRCGPTGTARSVTVMRQYPAGQFPVLLGLFFDEESWDGSDIFMPADDTALIFVTQRARDVIAAVARNVRFVRLLELEEPT